MLLPIPQSAPTLVNGNLALASNKSISWNGDLFVYREAANTLALRNNTNGQTLNIYATWIDAANNAGIRISHFGTNSFFYTFGVGSVSAGQMYLGVDSSVQWVIGHGGHFLALSDNVDIGSPGANRPRNVYISGYMKGKIQTDNAYTATPQTCSGYVTMYDSAGVALKVMVST